MTTNPRQPPLYRGLERAGAEAGLARWQPELGAHDFGPALRLARGLAGTSGRTLLITDRRANIPPDQRAAGVGHPIENVGFAGATLTRDDTGLSWRALIKNHASTLQRRTWHLEAAQSRSPEQTLELAPGAMTEISARFPDGVDEATIVLSGDAFTLDDRLPLVRPVPKPLAVIIDGKDDAAEFFKKLAGNIDGVTIAATPTSLPTPRLRIARLSVDEMTREARGGIFWPPADARKDVALANDPVTPERDELVAGLNWQGWLSTESHGYPGKVGDTTLLWQGKAPLVMVRAVSEETAKLGFPARKLLLSFDWAASNASRLPATVLLARRFLEAERDGQRAPYTANFDCNSLVPLPGIPHDAPLTLLFEPAQPTAISTAAPGGAEVRTIPLAEISELRAPGRAGRFTLKRGEELLVRGTAQFADARQSDFRSAERFFAEVRSERKAAIERNTRGDPFAEWWLVLLAALLLWSWWTKLSSSASSASVRAMPKPGNAPAVS